MEAEFATLQNMIVIVGGFLSFVLALIGILNFVNTILTGILSRKQEFAMLESVGMTRKQLREMLMWEGGYYALFTSIVAVLAGSILSMTLIKSYTSGFFFFTWKFTVLPILICIPFLLLIVLFVPYLACEKNVSYKCCRTDTERRIKKKIIVRRISALLKIPKSKGGLSPSCLLTLVSYHVTIEKNVERWGNRQ